MSVGARMVQLSAKMELPDCGGSVRCAAPSCHKSFVGPTTQTDALTSLFLTLPVFLPTTSQCPGPPVGVLTTLSPASFICPTVMATTPNCSWPCKMRSRPPHDDESKTDMELPSLESAKVSLLGLKWVIPSTSVTNTNFSFGTRLHRINSSGKGRSNEGSSTWLDSFIPSWQRS